MPLSTGQITSFPSQTVPDAVKASPDYGLEVFKAIQDEWFRRDGGVGRFYQTRDYYHKLRLYARGEQSTRRYKDDMAAGSNNDLSYLNLDFTPIPIAPKFVDIVVNGMSDRLYDVKCVAQDDVSVQKRTRYVERIERDMRTQDLLAKAESELGVNARNVNDPSQLPANRDELELHMQIGYKQTIEIAQEQAITNVFKMNKQHELQKRVYYDLTVLGIGACKHSFNNTDGIKLEYVDPADLIYSYTEEPDFSDCYYFGEIKRIRVTELRKLFPDLPNEVLDEALKKGQANDYDYSTEYEADDNYDSNTLNVVFFNWKTYENSVYKVKETALGLAKAVERDDSFNPPEEIAVGYERVAQSRECIYEGVGILGTNMVLKWEKAKNMVRPFSNVNTVMMNYILCAPRMYKGRLESIVSRLIPFVDTYQLDWLKLQQIRQRINPNGVYLNADGLAEIDLGNGTTMNPSEALNMYFQTGSIIGRSMTMDGDPNAGAIPIQELGSNSGGDKIQAFITSMQNTLQHMRDVTGINEARDGSDPDQYSLVGVQKLAAANSNVATRHLLDAGKYIASELANAVSLRFKDVLEFHPTKELFISSLGRFTVGALKEVQHLHLHDFGIFIELHPDEEEKQQLEAILNNAVAKQDISTEDYIDVMEIKNLKLAKQLLKYRRKKKMELDQQLQLQNIEAQAKANAEAAEAKAQAEAQAEQMKAQSKIQVEQMSAQLELERLERESVIKEKLMRIEHQLGLQTMDYQANLDMKKAKAEGESEGSGADGKVEKPANAFESAGNDVLGGFDLGSFEPK